jgi:hypothetical protein
MPLIQFDGLATGRPPMFARRWSWLASRTRFARHHKAESTTGVTTWAHVSVWPLCV